MRFPSARKLLISGILLAGSRLHAQDVAVPPPAPGLLPDAAAVDELVLDQPVFDPPGRVHLTDQVPIGLPVGVPVGLPIANRRNSPIALMGHEAYGEWVKSGCGSSGCGTAGRESVGCMPICNDSILDAFMNGEPDWAGLPKNHRVGCDWTVSAGGELRHRYMDEDNRLRPGGPGRSTYDLFRLTPYLKATYGDSVTGYVEAIDASIFNQELPITPIDQNRADLLQYYIDAKVADIGDGKLNVRVGRQTLQYGSQHLVSPLAWANTFRNFEGIRAYYTSADWDIDGFAVRPVNSGAGNSFRRHSFDHPDASRIFAGVYSSYKGIQNNTVDLYWLLLDENDERPTMLDGQRHTVGARLAGKQPMKQCDVVMTTWSWDLEGAYQFGEHETLGTATNEDIRAGMVTLNVGHQWNQVAWTPTVNGVFYWGSGDGNAGDGTNHTFDTLFPLGHAYWGIIDNLNGSNLFDYSLQATVNPTNKFNVVSAFHWFQKQEGTDPIFNVAGVPVQGPPATRTTSRDLGTELDLIGTYNFNANFNVQAGYSWFWYGNAITGDASLTRDDATQFYVMSTLKF